jgi:hypothetical protein
MRGRAISGALFRGGKGVIPKVAGRGFIVCSLLPKHHDLVTLHADFFQAERSG